MKTLYQRVMEVRLYSQNKHDLGETYAVDSINELTNDELLQEISEAIEEMTTEGVGK